MIKSNVKKIDLIYFIVFFADALISPFLALFFIACGYEGTKQGILLALIPLSNLLGNLLYGKLSFNLRRNLRIVSSLAAVQCFIMMFFGFLRNFVFLIIFTIIFAFHNSPLFSIEDGIACKCNENENKNYAITRMFGSLGYLIAVLIGGILIDKIDYCFTFIIAGILFGISSFLFFLIKPIDEEVKTKKEISFKTIFEKKQFVVYLIFYILVLGSWQVGEAYLSTYLKGLGMGVEQWGYCYAAQIAFEIAIILVLNKWLKKEENLEFGMILACSLMALRSLFLSMKFPIQILLFVEIPMRGIAWGIFLSVNVNLLTKILNSDLVTKAITICAISLSVFSSIFEYLCPRIFADYSNLFLVLGMIQLIGLVIFMKSNLLNTKENSN